MTLHLHGNRSLVWTLCAAWLATSLAACGTATKSTSIELTAPADGATLTLADDIDPLQDGLQVDVQGTSHGVPAGSMVLLKIADDASSVTTTVASGGDITFAAATLPPGTHTIYAVTATGSASSDPERTYTFRSLEIRTPVAGATLDASDDLDTSTEAVDVNVSVDAYGIDASSEVTLLVDGEAFAQTSAVAGDRATFASVALGSGTHTLQAQAGTGADKVLSEEIRVTVESSLKCPVVDFIVPTAPTGGADLVLGGASCPDSGEFATTVAISTDAAEGADVELTVNGNVVGHATVSGAQASFTDVVLDRRTASNTLSVAIDGAGGAACAKVDFPADVFVDCAGADCTIASPEPVEGVDEDGNPALYLNAKKRGADGFVVEVDTDSQALGQSVELIVDGNERKAKHADAEQQGDKVRATFAALALAEGAHTVEARCVDAAGNVTYSAEQTWIVDTTPCGLDITAPSEGALVVAADDASADSGMQIAVTSLAGSDCSAARASECVPADGITGVAFADYDGSSPLVSEVTVASAGTRTLCVEVRDRAGNRSSDDVQVSYRDASPSVSIESPATGTSYNIAGDSTHEADENTATDSCEATFTALCSEVGEEVALRYDNAAGAAFATGTCIAAAGLPTGYAGRATFSELTFLPDGVEAATVVATQTITSDSANDLLGESTPIDVSGDCRAPVLSFATNPCATGFVVTDTTEHITQDITGLDGSGDTAEATLAVTNPNSGAGAINSTVTQALASGSTTFTAIDLGTAGTTSTSTATIVLTVTDDFGNAVSDSCMVDIAHTTPMLTVTQPTSADPTYGPGGGCDPGVAGAYGVPVVGTADQAENRTASATIDSVDYPLTLTGTDITGCVPASEGANSLEIQLTSTATGAQDTETATFTVDSLEVTTPDQGSTTNASTTCSTGVGGESGVTVSGIADTSHDTRTVSLQAGANREVTTSVAAGAFSACVPVSIGANSVVVSVLDGITVLATETRSFTAALITPSNGIPITFVAPPATGSATYRSSPVALGWSAPVEDFADQLVSYELRCANSALNVGVATQGEQDAWWTAAEVMTLPVATTPPATTANVTFRIGDNRHCVLRGVDGSDQMTPLVNSSAVSYPFRSKVFQPTSTGQKMGEDVAPVGDVNGDGYSDLLVGGLGEAYLIFGSQTGWSASTPDVVFVGATASRFGGSVAGIGDFNDDGMNDFAISEARFQNGSLTNAGRVFVFYGRALVGGLSDWPASVAISPTLCSADVCFSHELKGFLGFGMSSAGDFNGDGVVDLAVGAPNYPGPTLPSQLFGRLYVLLGQKFEASLTKPLGEAFWQIEVAVPSGARGLYIEGDNVTVNLLGNSVAALGDFDGVAGDDLVVGAPSGTAVAVAPAAAFFLSGHPYDFGTDTGMVQLATNRLGLRDAGGTPSGLPIDTGTKGYFGAFVYALGNAIDLGSGTAGMQDIAIRQGSTNEFVLYPGDSDFDTADVIRLQGDQTGKNPSTGISVGTGFAPALATLDLSDLDGDGLSDVCAGESLSSTTGAAPGNAYLWYASVVETKTNAGVLSYTEAASVAPAAVSGAGTRVVDFVGDLDDDGAPDMAIGDASATSNNGAVTILY